MGTAVIAGAAEVAPTLDLHRLQAYDIPISRGGRGAHRQHGTRWAQYSIRRHAVHGAQPPLGGRTALRSRVEATSPRRRISLAGGRWRRRASACCISAAACAGASSAWRPDSTTCQTDSTRNICRSKGPRYSPERRFRSRADFVNFSYSCRKVRYCSGGKFGYSATQEAWASSQDPR